MTRRKFPWSVLCAQALILALVVGPWLGFRLGGALAAWLFPPSGDAACGLSAAAGVVLPALFCGAPTGLVLSISAVGWLCFRRKPSPPGTGQRPCQNHG